VARLAADLPDALVLLRPADSGGVSEVDEEPLGRRAQSVELFGEAAGGVEQFAVHIQLALAPRPVANADRCAVAPSGEVGPLSLAEIALAAHAEHDLQVGPLASL